MTEKQEWNVGFCDCMKPPHLCSAVWWKALCCPCLLLSEYVYDGGLQRDVDTPESVRNYHIGFCAFGFCAGILLSPAWFILPLLATAPYRKTLRTKYGLSDTCCCFDSLGPGFGDLGDYCSECMLCPCGIAQDYLEVKSRING